MRVVVVGGYGLIGGYVVSRLLADGAEVVGVGRDVAAARRRFPTATWHRLDLRSAQPDAWVAMLRGSTAVVNCAGAMQQSPRDDLVGVHVEAVRGLASACRASGVRRFVHLSAAGLEADPASAFSRTKLAAEEGVRATDLDWVILRPGLVLAPAAYGGSALLRGLAAFPLFVPLAWPDSVVGVVSVEDVAAAVSQALAPGAPARVSVDLILGGETTLASIVAELRGWLGLPPVRVLRIPATLGHAVAILADGLGLLGWRSPMRIAALRQLRAGVRGDDGAARRYFDLELRSLRQMLDRWPAGVQERWFARAYFLKPAIIAVLAAFWFASGLIALSLRFDQAAAVLSVGGVPPPVAGVAVVAGSLIDLTLALGVCVRPTSALALGGMVVASAAYLIGATVLRPDLWLDPLGPLIKIAPALLLATVALAMREER